MMNKSFSKIRMLRGAEITYYTFPSRKRRQRDGNEGEILGKYFFRVSSLIDSQATQIQNPTHVPYLAVLSSQALFAIFPFFVTDPLGCGNSCAFDFLKIR
mgnify:CR=1 FL=1